MLRQRRIKPCRVLLRGRLDHRVGPQSTYAATDETHGFVHGVGKCVACVTADYERALLSHERSHVPAIARDQHRAALHRDAQARRCIAVNDHGSAADGRRRAIARAAAHHDLAAQH